MNILVWRRTDFGIAAKKEKAQHRAVLNSQLEEMLTTRVDGTYLAAWSDESFDTLGQAKARVTTYLTARIRRGR